MDFVNDTTCDVNLKGIMQSNEGVGILQRTGICCCMGVCVEHEQKRFCVKPSYGWVTIPNIQKLHEICTCFHLVCLSSCWISAGVLCSFSRTPQAMGKTPQHEKCVFFFHTCVKNTPIITYFLEVIFSSLKNLLYRSIS